MDGLVTLLSPEVFNQDYNAHKAAADQAAITRLEELARSNTASAGRRRHAKHASQVLDNQLSLWSPFGKRLRLGGVKAGGSVIRDPTRRLSALSSAWSRTFAHKPIDIDKAKDYLCAHTHSHFNFKDVQPPSKQDFRNYLARVPHSSPGNDGIPYVA